MDRPDNPTLATAEPADALIRDAFRDLGETAYLDVAARGPLPSAARRAAEAMLLGQAQARQWEWGITRQDVLQRVAQGLQDSDVFSADEAQWVLTRLEELLSC